MARWESVGIAGALFAIVCCAGLPLLVGVIGGLTATALIGVIGGLVVVLAAAFAVAIRLRRRATPPLRRHKDP
jgi:hypothetical protein